jgi:hypothetical protein
MALSPDTPTLTAERLQAIRDADAMAGDDLQNCPPAWQHRRELLAYADALTAPKRQDVVLVSLLGDQGNQPLGVYSSPDAAQAAAEGSPYLANLTGTPFTVDAPLVSA